MSAATDRAIDASAIRRPSTISRVYGLGSVFGKTLRDARWAVVSFAAFLTMIVGVSAAAYVSEFDTLPERLTLAAQMAALPAAFAGLLGPPVNLETLPGFLSWRSLGFVPVFVGIWSIVALSGTIAGEAARGSLEMLVALPRRRGSIASHKAAAHVMGMAIALGIAAVATWAITVSMGTLPGDATTLTASVGMFGWIMVMSLAGGAAAFAAGSFLGRSAAAGVGALLLIGSFLVNGYADLIPGFDVLQRLSIFDWTEGFRPMTDQWDWLGIAAVAALDVVLLVVGVVAFARRDLGSTIRIRGSGRAFLPRGLSGPTARSASEQLPVAVAGGLALGAFGFLVSLSAQSIIDLFDESPQFKELFDRFLPGADLTTAGGVLEVYFVSFGTLLFGLLAAAIVSGWTSDERERRLDLVLATPQSRVRWAIASGIGAFIGIAVLVALLSVGIIIGTLALGDDFVEPVLGSIVLGLFAAAFVGAGLAVGGLRWPGPAAAIVAGLTIGTFLLELLGGLLRFPDWVMSLSLIHHLGHPMTGDYDVPGILLMAGLAVGGLLVSAWGMGRRDIGR